MDITSILVFLLALAVGFIGFVQIYWSIKKAKQRGAGFTAGTIIVWGAILIAAAWAIAKYTAYFNPFSIGYLVAAAVLLITQAIRVRLS